MLKPVLLATYLTVALGGIAVMAVLLLADVEAIILTVNLHAGLLGCALGVVAAYQWEVLGKGVSELRRGQALALAFGAGPILAFLASLGSQQVLTCIAYPWNFAALFGATGPITALAALLSTRFVVPRPAVEIVRPPLFEGVFGGLGDFFRHRLILIAAVATVLVSSGYNVLTNMSLFTREATGAEPEAYAGYQNALRFGFKAVAGLFLGWLLTRTHPKAGMLVTGSFCLASVVWVLLVPGIWFLLSFGLMGVGELFGVYYPNYILSCSAKAKIRRNMAFSIMLNMPSGFAPLLFGFIATTIGARYGDEKFGFQVSFLASISLLILTLLLVLVALPARPWKEEE
jgi:MFS family permease